MAKLLVTTDFSKRSKSALKHAIQLSKEWGKSTITLVFVLEYNVPSPLYAHYEFLLPDRKVIEKDLRKFVGKVPSNVTLKVVTAPTVVRGLLQAAKDSKADYIVISSHGHGAIGSMFLGSTTQRLIASTSLPVIVVR